MIHKPPMPKKVPERGRWSDFEDEFHRLLGRLVHTTARLDFHIGLQLHGLGPFYGVEVADALDPVKSKISCRLKKLRQVLRHALKDAPAPVQSDFKAWFDQVDLARAMRNDYVHGRWAAPGPLKFKPPGRLIDAEPLLAVVPLGWDMRPDRPDPSIVMTIEELAAQVEEAEALSLDFMNLLDRHVLFMAPGSRG